MDNKWQIQIVQNLVPVLNADVTIGGGKNITFGDTMTGTGTPTDPINVSNTVLQQISDNAEQSAENASQISDIQNTLSNVQDGIQNATEQISDIQSVIPATANPENQLADQGFVNSTVQTATAYFRGDWATWADVPSDPSLYPVDATGNRTPTTNDYMVVISDEQINGGTWRYKYTGLWSEQGKDGWQAEYQVNETPLTAAQLAALNSGITAEDVASYVKNTDYAGWDKAGIIKASENLGTMVNDAGYLQAVTTLLQAYNAATNFLFVGKGTLENIKDDYIKRGITANTIALTDEEKAAAQSWLGIESGGGSSLPDQTGNAGKFLTTDGTTASWGGDNLVQDNANFKGNGLAVGARSVALASGSTAYGTNSQAKGQNAVAIGAYSETSGQGVAIGGNAKSTALRAIQLGGGTNSDANTFKVGNANGNFEMMDANGNVPLERLTYVTNQIGDISTALTAILGE